VTLEDWSNDAESSALITGTNYTILYIHLETMTVFVCIFIVEACW